MLCVAQRITYKCDLVNVGSCLCRQAGFAALGYVSECYSPTLTLQARRRQTTVSFINKHMNQAIHSSLKVLIFFFSIIASSIHIILPSFIQQSVPSASVLHIRVLNLSLLPSRRLINTVFRSRPNSLRSLPPPPPPPLSFPSSSFFFHNPSFFFALVPLECVTRNEDNH